jgi:hypothetical protein
MTPDKIKEGFEAWAKFLEDDHNGYIYSEQAWQACAEWMLSQVEKEFDLAICSEWQGTLTEYELSQVKNVWMIARLSSAKEIASLKDQILRYEQDNRELRAKGIKEIAEKDARVKQLEQGLDMSLLVSRQYREAIEESLNMSTRGKLSPNDAKILIKQVIEISQRKTKGLDETAPETYLKLKKEIAEKDALITKTRNDREAQYKLGCDTQADLNKANEELFFARERVKELEVALAMLTESSDCRADEDCDHCFALAVLNIASKKEST